MVSSEALDIAMSCTPMRRKYTAVESVAAEAILDDWRKGARNKTALANKAIAEVEEHYPQASRLRQAS